MLASLWVSLQRGWLYTRRSYLDLVAASEKLHKAKDERIADLKESAVLLRATVKEREDQIAILMSGRQQ